jgi:hypothetical protein
MNIVMTLYIALLFLVLTPGILVSLPPKGSRLTVALTHAAVFALVYHLTHKMVWRLSLTMERFQGEADSKKPMGTPAAVEKK